MSSEDDTEPVPLRGDPRVEFNSALVPPGESSVISLRLARDMPRARVFASAEPRDAKGRVVVVEISCEEIQVSEESETIESLRFGRELNASLSQGTTVTFRVRNDSAEDVRVGVSIVSDDLVKEKP